MKITATLAIVTLFTATVWGAEGSVLHLANGGFLSGKLQGSEQPTVLRWKSDSFAKPFDFSIDRVTAVHFNVAAELPKPEGEYCLELAGGDVLFGNVLSLSDQTLELDAGRFGKLQVQRTKICRLYRWSGGAELIYLGPNGLIGWTEPAGARHWRSEGGQPLSDQDGAQIRGDFKIPTQALIEFELSWKTKADFVFALGLDNNDDDVQFKRAYRFEVWDNDLVVGCEQAREADVAAVQEIRPGPGRIHLLAYLDQDKGKLSVYSPVGVQLAEVGITPRKKQVYSGLRLANKQGDIRLDRLRISRWNGIAPREVQANKSRLDRTDGSFVYGQLTAYDAASKQFTVRDEDKELKIPAEEISVVLVAPPQEAAVTPFRAVYQDGNRIGGQVTQIGDDFAIVKNDAVQNPLRLPLAELRSLVIQPRGRAILGMELSAAEKSLLVVSVIADGPADRGQIKAGDRIVEIEGKKLEDNATDVMAGLLQGNEGTTVNLVVVDSTGNRRQLRISRQIVSVPGTNRDAAVIPPSTEKGSGRLELDGVRLHGKLVDGPGPSDPSCLVWQPEFSATASSLLPNVSGRIVYREPPPKPKTTVSTMEAVRPGVVVRVGGPTPTRRPTIVNSNAPKTMHLRSGDTIPCEVVRIDDKGITFKSPSSEASFVTHDKVKAVELVGSLTPPKLTKAKRDRLLTLPRLQTDSPPTHLMPTTNGDFLRGRLVSLDDKKAVVEIRLENVEIPRDKIAQIIWLHPDELAETAVAPVTPADPSTKLRVQALRSDGMRMTFLPEQFSEQVLSGTSDILGKCKSDVTQLEQLLIGGTIELAAADLVYHKWKLHRAVQPKIAADLDSGSPGAKTPGTESGLVGKPAPTFELPMLNGSTFRLEDNRGRILVIDFWASWCGPCMQGLPEVERVVREIGNNDVRLIAINMQETAKEITATLERNKLQIPVALDRDGAVAPRFEVTAIPQTVIIDRDGKVARLYVGGGPHLPEQLREAIRGLLSPEPPNTQTQE